MDYRSLLLIGVVLGAGAAAFSTACNGPDPGAITFAERESQAGEGPSGSGNSNDDTSDDTGKDAAVDDPIFGTSAFTYEDPGVAANEQDALHEGSVEGKNCLQAGCHLDGAKPWVFGGTVYTAAQNGQTVAKAEVRVVGPDNTEIGRAYTDANGNFWLDKPGTTIPSGSKVGVRKEGGQPRMMATLLDTTNGGCGSTDSNCHGTPVTGKIFAQ